MQWKLLYAISRTRICRIKVADQDGSFQTNCFVCKAVARLELCSVDHHCNCFGTTGISGDT